MGKKSKGKTYTSKGERKSSIGHKNTDQGYSLIEPVKSIRKR